MVYPEYQAFIPANQPAGAVPPLEPTAGDIEGPFYKADAPFRERLSDAADLFLSGHVTAIDGQAVAGAVLDFWQADAKGVYDNEGFKLRGKVRSGGDGGYRIATVRPGHYAISDTEERCSHVHVKVTAAGFKPLTTQLYFGSDPANKADHWFDPKRCVHFTRREDECRFDFVLEQA